MSKYMKLKLPNYIAVDLRPTTIFYNKIISTNAGNDICYSNYDIEKKEYYLEDCKISKKQLKDFYNFFVKCKGQKYPFSMIDYYNYKKTIRINNINQNQINLNEYFPTITPYILTDSIILKSDKQVLKYSINKKNLTITLDSTISNKDNLYISFLFETIARFNQDSFNYKENNDNTITLNLIKIIEVL